MGERFSSWEHWLKFDNFFEVVGCQCGFVASDSDEGFGDSVVDHIASVAASVALESASADTAEFDTQVRAHYDRYEARSVAAAELIRQEIDDHRHDYHTQKRLLEILALVDPVDAAVGTDTDTPKETEK